MALQQRAARLDEIIHNDDVAVLGLPLLDLHDALVAVTHFSANDLHSPAPGTSTSVQMTRTNMFIAGRSCFFKPSNYRGFMMWTIGLLHILSSKKPSGLKQHAATHVTYVAACRVVQVVGTGSLTVPPA